MAKNKKSGVEMDSAAAEDFTPEGSTAEEPSQEGEARDEPKKTRADIELEKELAEFQDITYKADGWLQPSPGAWILGRLNGRHQLGSGKKARFFYQIQVRGVGAPRSSQNPDGDVFMVKGKGEEAETLSVMKNDVVAVDERKALEALQRYADSNGVYDVYLKFLEKITIEGGTNTFWRMEIKCKTLRAPSDLKDEIPF